MSTNLRVVLQVDGVTLPDLFFSHPSFAGGTIQAQVYAELVPAQPTQYTIPSTTFTVTAKVPTFAPNDSHNPVLYAP
jgi:hypothetical protein